MSTKNTLIFSAVLVILATLAGLLFWDQFPARMASHWDVNDQVNGYITRFWGVFLLPLICLGMLLLLVGIPRLDPLRKNIDKFRPAFNLFIFFMVAFLVYLHVLTLVYNLGHAFPMSRAMLPAMGLLFFYIGVLLKQARRNWFIGIRTPWTLSSDVVWAKTHRLGALLFKICALLVVISALLGGSWAFALVFFPLIGVTLFLVIYSYVLFRQEINPGS